MTNWGKYKEVYKKAFEKCNFKRVHEAADVKPQKCCRKILVHIVLILVLVWLIVGIVIYFLKNIRIPDFESVFFLRDKPLLSVFLLSLLVTTYLIFKNQYWARFITSLYRFRSLNRLTQQIILLSATFYIILVAIALLFPQWTVKTDWSLLIVAAIPLLVFILSNIIERASSLKAKIGAFEFEFVITPISQSVTLEEEVVTKSVSSDLPGIVEKIKSSLKLPEILVVPMKRGMRIEFLALRDYVYELSKITPIEYIVFVDGMQKYLGFMTVEKFKKKYPKFAIEILLDEYDRNERAKGWWVKFFRLQSDEIPKALEQMRNELVLPLWDPQRRKYDITELDLNRLGSTPLHIRKTNVIEAYRKILDNDIPGIPVVDESMVFMGVATREEIIRKVIAQLLSSAEIGERIRP